MATHTFASLLLVAPSLGLHFISNYTQNPPLQIQLADGLIQGRLRHTVDSGMPYYSYEGIPYAKPPVGELRFEPPQPAEKWEGVLDADGNVPVCIQVGPRGPHEDEDCLYINVYVPKPAGSDEARSKAVMVWIYGGGFLMGAARRDVYGPDYLLEQDVIVVHFNYRLNVFGFLATGDMGVPGNAGLKDQQAALKWVHDNIHAFGGDPDNVTIFGESAGAASIGYQLVNNKNQGLFQRAISQSGSPLCLWSLQRNPLSVARKVALASGFTFGSTESLILHLKRAKASTLKTAAASVLLADVVRLQSSLPFAPVLEPEHDGAFLTRSTYEMLESGDFVKVPHLLGFNSEEAALSHRIIEVVHHILNVLPPDLLVPGSLNLNGGGRVGEEIKSHYFGDSTKAKSKQFLEFYSDNGCNRPVTQAARFFASQVPTYMYVFSYEGYYLGKKAWAMGEDNGIEGVSHGEDLWYLWAKDDLRYANSTDDLMRRRMTKLWTNFAKYGNPTPDGDELLQNIIWPQHDEDFAYLNIDVDLKVAHDFKRETMEFWRQLFAKYGRPPFYTY